MKECEKCDDSTSHFKKNDFLKKKMNFDECVKMFLKKIVDQFNEILKEHKKFDNQIKFFEKLFCAKFNFGKYVKNKFVKTFH